MNTSGTKNNGKGWDESERAMRALVVVMLIGLAVVTVYSLQSKHLVKVAGVLLMVSGASALVGGFFGFLFGIPRASQAESQGSPSGSGGKGAEGDASRAEGRYRPNTNLEQISDWLTKILVGVGLTQITVVPERLRQMAEIVSADFSGSEASPTLAVAVMVFFCFCGFLFCYLWARLYLGAALAKADALMSFVKKFGQDAEEAKKQAEVAKSAVMFGIGGKKESATPALMKLVEERDIQPGPVSDDPWKGQFGGQSRAGDRQLLAEVSKIEDGTEYYLVRLAVVSTDPSKNSLTGTVKFFLHPTFAKDKPIVKVGPDGKAELTLAAWGAFTVGALADDGRTTLELDLAELPGAPAAFKSR